MGDSLEALARNAAAKAQGGYTPTDAVVESLRQQHAGAEKIARVCALTNKILLETKKHSAYESGKGRLWTERINTAKPDEVCRALGVTPDYPAPSAIDEVQKHSSPGSAKYSGALDLDAALRALERPVVLPTVKTSAPAATPVVPRSAAMCLMDVQDLLRTQQEALQIAQQRLEAAQLEKISCQAGLEGRLAQVVAEGTSLGDALWVIKQSCGAEEFQDCFDFALKRYDLDPATLLKQSQKGKTQTGGTEMLRRTPGHWTVNEDHPLRQSARALSEASTRYHMLKVASLLLSRQRQQWDHKISQTFQE